MHCTFVTSPSIFVQVPLFYPKITVSEENYHLLTEECKPNSHVVTVSLTQFVTSG